MEDHELEGLCRNICIDAHKGQFRRDGITPYSDHPIAVANSLPPGIERNVAYLHDVLEDTDYTRYRLYECGVPEDIVNIVALLTKWKNQSYESYIHGLMRGVDCSIAIRVKIADIIHNLSDNPTDKQKSKYRKTLNILAGVY